MSSSQAKPRLTRLNFKQRLILTVASPVISTTVRILCSSSREETRNRRFLNSVLAGHGKALVGFWHETLALATWHFRKTGYYTLTSLSFDGELASRVVHRFGLHAVRGSSSRGGWQAISDMFDSFQVTQAVGFTLDGPRGPRREAKPGIGILSMRGSLPVVPVAFAAIPCWRMHTWDRLVLPKPFSRIIAYYGEPVWPQGDLSPEGIESLRRTVEESLNRLHGELEDDTSMAPQDDSGDP